MDALLEGTGLKLDDLLSSDQAVSFGETRQVLSNVSRALGPDWHLSLAPRLTIPAHGPLGSGGTQIPSLPRKAIIIGFLTSRWKLILK